MEILDATGMKRITDKRNEEINEEIKEKLQAKMLDATKNGYYNIMVETLPIPIVEELKNMGYEIKYGEREDNRIIISWRK